METGKVADGQSGTLLCRYEFVVEARWAQNVTVYRCKEWKLFVGSYQFFEPDGVAALNSFDAGN